jgi:N-acetylmuramoyl-L-alanine amidase
MVRTLKPLFILLFCIGTLYSANTLSLIESADTLLKQNTKSSLIKARNNYKSAYLKALLNDNTALSKRALIGVTTTEKQIKNVKKSPLSKKNYLTNYSSSQNTITLTFKYPIDKKQIKPFTLRKKNIFRYVVDFNAILDGGKTVIKSQYFRNITLAQYSKKTIRLVIEKKRNFDIHVTQNKKTITLSATLNKSISNTKKAALSPIKKASYTPIVKSRPSNKLILIDAGHGGKDGGATGYKKTLEKNIVLAITLSLEKELKKRGYKTKLTRREDKFIKLKQRTKIANQSNADLFISIHANSTASKKIHVKGIESYFLSPAKSERAKRVAAIENQVDIKTMNSSSQNTFLSVLNRSKVIESNKLAIDVQKNILTTLQAKYNHVKDNGVREAPFWVLVGAQMPAVLIEVGFITNPLEAKRMRTKKYQTQIAQGIANGIDSYFYHN